MPSSEPRKRRNRKIPNADCDVIGGFRTIFQLNLHKERTLKNFALWIFIEKEVGKIASAYRDVIREFRLKFQLMPKQKFEL